MSTATTTLLSEALDTFATLFDEAQAAGEPDRTAMTVATAKEHAWLAVMAGQAGIADPAGARVGALIEEKARAGHRPARSPGSHAGPSLIGRLIAALAA